MKTFAARAAVSVTERIWVITASGLRESSGTSIRAWSVIPFLDARRTRPAIQARWSLIFIEVCWKEGSTSILPTPNIPRVNSD